MDYTPDKLSDMIGDILSEVRKPCAKKPDVPLSKKQIDVHYDDLYLGYIKKLSEIERKLKTADRKSANASYSEFGALKQSLSLVSNAVRMHGYYFNGLGKSKRSEYISQSIASSFSKISKWEDDFIATAMAAKGWAMLCYDLDESKLINVACDAHDIGVICGAIPIVVCDIYDHAYYIDFQSNKSKYIEFFIEHINWDYATSRLTNVEK